MLLEKPSAYPGSSGQWVLTIGLQPSGVMDSQSGFLRSLCSALLSEPHRPRWLRCAQRAMRLLRHQSTFCVLACPTAVSDTEYSVRLQSHWTLCCTTVPPHKYSGFAPSHPGSIGVSFRAGLLTSVGDLVERCCYLRAFFRLCFSIKARALLLVLPGFPLLSVSCLG